jgi:D-methionine transport system ATP-binding protein
MIELKNISKSFYVKKRELPVLSGVSLSVERGRITGLIGSSGAGKSTLLRIVNLLERPTNGDVLIDGRSLLSMPANELTQLRRETGMIFQHFNLLSSRTVAENVAFPLELANTSRAEINRKVADALQWVGLAEKADAYPAGLSGGQKQRVAIARTLVTNPRLLLCDEVTSALDPATTRSILSLLKDINRRLGITILLITHEMEVIKAICDKVGVIHHGELIEYGAVKDVFAHPATEITKQFIASSVHVELPAAYRQKLQSAPGGEVVRSVVKLSLSGHTADEPVLSQAARNFSIDLKIISAQLDSAEDKRFGVILAELSGSSANVEQALSFFRDKNIETEIIEYV